MKAFLRQNLEKHSQRLHDLESLLASPDIMANMKAFRDLSKEHAEIMPVASRYARYQKVEADMASAQEMLQDADMAEMAQEEIDSGAAELAKLEAELQRLLLPKDPKDLLCGVYGKDGINETPTPAEREEHEKAYGEFALMDEPGDVGDLEDYFHPDYSFN